MYTVGPGIWRETIKMWKMRNEHCRTWKLARKLKNVGNETRILYDLAYGKKHSKTWKMRNAHCRTWSMAGKMKIMENEKNIL